MKTPVTDNSKQEIEVATNPSAPYVVFDSIITTGFLNGTLQINVGAKNFVRRVGGDGLKVVLAETGHIRMTPTAARELLIALESFIAHVDKESVTSGSSH